VIIIVLTSFCRFCSLTHQRRLAHPVDVAGENFDLCSPAVTIVLRLPAIGGIAYSRKYTRGTESAPRSRGCFDRGWAGRRHHPGGRRDLIQSVLNSAARTVREAMKPRPEMFAVPVETTVERFIEMMRTKHYSRVPAMPRAFITSGA